MQTLYQIINQGLLILEGWTKWGIDRLRGKISPEAQRRLDICNKCPFNNRGVCSHCGCVLKAKVRVDFPLDENGLTIDGCPENKW